MHNFGIKLTGRKSKEKTNERNNQIKNNNKKSYFLRNKMALCFLASTVTFSSPLSMSKIKATK